MEKQALVLATRNKGKTEENCSLLNDYPGELKNLDDFGLVPVVFEGGGTFDANKSFALLTLEEKNKISQRGRALTGLAGGFGKVLKWIDQNMPRMEKFDCVK